MRVIAVAGASLLLTIKLLVPGGIGSSGVAGEEFVGPFANWLNVKTTAGCGAIGDGFTDDTTAIQNCLNKLNSTTPVLYFPAGTYAISGTLTVPLDSLNVAVVGQAPSPACSGEGGTVCIKWIGAANAIGPMLDTQSTRYSKYDRLTLNGNNTVGVLVRQDQAAGHAFDTHNEYADDVFMGAGGTFNSGNVVDFLCGYAISGSALTTGAAGCAETAMLRDSFNGGYAGVFMGNFNALNLWVWYSSFNSKGIGLSNNPAAGGAGNFHSFYNNFFNSSTFDLALGNTGTMMFFGNYSSGSSQFLNCFPSDNPASLVLEANTIINSANSLAVSCQNQGPLIVFDNNIYSCTTLDGCSGNATAPAITMFNETPNDMLSTRNNYTVGATNSTCTTGSPVLSTGRCHSLGDSVVAHAHPAAPALPPTPPNKSRTIYEVTSAGGIAAAVASACPSGSTAGSVVHLQAGTYSISTTITIPANTFCQIIGDGGNTVLSWGGTGGVVIQLTGPSKAMLRDFQITGNSTSSGLAGIKITNADQVNGRTFAEQLDVSSNGTGILVNALGNAIVELHDAVMASDSTDSINVAGAAPNNGGLNLFGAAGNGSANIFRITANGNLSARQFWDDAGGTPANATVAMLSGTGGKLSIADMTAYPENATLTVPFIGLSGFTGTSALIDVNSGEAYSSSAANEAITGSSSGANNLNVGYTACQSAAFSDTSSPADTSGFLNSQKFTTACTTSSGASGPGIALSESGTGTLAFLDITLAQLRAALPTVPGAAGDPSLPVGITDARLYRVSVTNCTTALDVEH